MMGRFIRAGLLAFRMGVAGGCCLAMAGCLGLGAKEEAPKPRIVGFPRGNTSDGTPKEPQLVGRVAMVNDDARFVLIACEALRAPVEGTALKAMRGSEETAILSVSAERRGAHVTADIVTGSPSRGDEVFQ